MRTRTYSEFAKNVLETKQKYDINNLIGCGQLELKISF